MNSTPAHTPESPQHKHESKETLIWKVSWKIGNVVKNTSQSLFSVFNAITYNKFKTIGQLGWVIKKLGHIGDDGVQTAQTWSEFADNSWKETKASYGTVLEPWSKTVKNHIDNLETTTENKVLYARSEPSTFKRWENLIKRVATLPIKTVWSTVSAIGNTLARPFAYMGMSDKKMYKPLKQIWWNRWDDMKSYTHDIFARNRGKKAQKEWKTVHFVDQEQPHSKAA